MNSRLIPVIILLVTLQSCARQLSYESFVKTSDAGAGRYDFSLDLSDTTRVYDLYLFTRVDRSVSLGASDRRPQKLDIQWISPTGMVYDESVFMDMGDYRGVKQLYRRGIVPSENGQWTLRIRPENVPATFRGIGVICEQNGTR